jgi:hypothetical protein
MTQNPPVLHRGVAPGRVSLSWNFAEWFVLSQTLLPALLYLPGSQVFRIEIRMAAYGISLGALFYTWFSRKKGAAFASHPAVPCLVVTIGYLCLMLLHPQTNSVVAGSAQIALYLSIMAPVFWAPSFVKSPERLRRVLWLMLVCNGINAFFGVMQVRDPGTWMPRDFSAVTEGSEFGLDAVSFRGPNGETIVRPPGLGDAPGAVSGPAALALFLGLVFTVEKGKWWQRILGGVFAILGAAALFFSEVRSLFLISIGILIVYLLLQVFQGRYRQALLLTGIAITVIVVAFLRSSSMGGEGVVDRIATIFEDDPVTFYQKNRGGQVVDSFSEILPEYPLGAGLGRWGMINLYFGSRSSTAPPPIWVEIQIPAWIVDGGVPLLILYSLALWITFSHQVRVVFRGRDPKVQVLATIILATNVGVACLCLSYPVFVSPLGAQFWFLSGALYGVARGTAPVAGRSPRWKRGVPARAHPRFS